MNEFEHGVTDVALAEFVAATGVDIAQARVVLQQYSYDVIGALKAYEQNQFHMTMVNVGQNGLANGTNNNHDKANGSNHISNGNHQATNGNHQATNGNQHNGTIHHQCNGSECDESCSHESSTSPSTSHRSITADSSVKSDTVPPTCHIETPSYTFTLPDLSTLSAEFRRFLERDLMETSTQRGLEASGHLNWWLGVDGVTKLWPLATSGDGNCLLHAASLGMWGFHDRLLILRNALHSLLTTGGRRHALWRRWRWHQTRVNLQSGLIYSEDEWRTEWNNLVQLSSAEPRSKKLIKKSGTFVNGETVNGTANVESTEKEAPAEDEFEPCTSSATYESLEDIHVFALAHVLKRPIIVMADTVLRDADGQPMAPIPFRGIYLPLECPPAESHRAPLVLCYDAAHFSALVAMQSNGLSREARLPITCRQRRLLPVHFANDPGADFTWWTDARDERIADAARLSEWDKLRLVCRYMEIDTLDVPVLRTTSLPRTARSSAPLGTMRRSNGAVGSFGTIKTARDADAQYHLKLAVRHARDRCRVAWRHVRATKRSRHASGITDTSTSLAHNVTDRAEDDLTNGSSVVNHDGQAVPLASLHSPLHLVCARLLPDTHHQYMKEMVDNYLQSARHRFDGLSVVTHDAKQTTSLQPNSARSATTSLSPAVDASSLSVSPRDASSESSTRSSRRRGRGISRSLSTTSIVVECMNGNCTQTASTSTNFLCTSCFLTQKEVMASFSGGHRRTDSATTAPSPRAVVCTVNKSATLPHMVTTKDGGTVLTTLLNGNMTTQRFVHDAGHGSRTQHGLTHYYPPSTLPPSMIADRCTSLCRSALCANYSNGHATLCRACYARHTQHKAHYE